MSRAIGARGISFVGGLVMGVVVLLPGYVFFSTARAGHGSLNCTTARVTWNEHVKENDTIGEDGVRADIKIGYPDGGPTDTYDADGGLVRSLYMFRNADNHTEVGWLWRQNKETQPTVFASWVDGGVFNLSKSGFAGAKDTYAGFKATNTFNTNWHYFHNGTRFHERNFDSLGADMFAFGNSEVDNACDWAGAHFKDLMDKGCDSCDFVSWRDTQHYEDPNLCCENPCFQVNLIAHNEFGVDHGGC